MTVTVQAGTVGAAATVPAAALGLVALRATRAASSVAWPPVVAIEIMEGLSMGFAGVAIPALVADVMSDSGHANAGLGGVMTAYGVGAALRPGLAGTVARVAGFPASFATLGGVAAIGYAGSILGWRAATRRRDAGIGGSRAGDRP